MKPAMLHHHQPHPNTNHANHGWRLLVLFALLTLALSACTPKIIKGTTIANTKENREIFHAVEQYRQSVLNRDWRQLLTLISSRYHEPGTKPDSSDDYGYKELHKYLTSPQFKEIRYVRMKLNVERIEHKDQEARVYIRSHYSFQYPRGPYRPGWKTGIEDFMLVFEFTNNQWLILRGI